MFPSEEEMKAAQLICCGRFCNQCETPAAYAWRKREVDLAVLLERAIIEELTKTERELVVEYWYNSLTQSQIAKKRGVSSAAVKATLDRAKEKLERVLSYAVMYQQGVTKRNVVPLVLARARVIAAARNSSGGNSGDRLMRLRQSECLAMESVSAVTGIAVRRIAELENGSAPKCDELIILSEFYGVTVDFILKGDINDR